MPTGVYPRKKRPEKPKNKYSTTGLTGTIGKFAGDTQLAEIDKLIEELKQRRAEIKTGGLERQKLLDHCIQKNLGRADVGWVYHQLPPLRVTRKAREAKAKQ